MSMSESLRLADTDDDRTGMGAVSADCWPISAEEEVIRMQVPSQ